MSLIILGPPAKIVSRSYMMTLDKLGDVDTIKDVSLYLKWIAILCVIMAAFAVGIIFIGYKDLSIGRAMTVICLLITAGACGFISKKKRNR